MCVIIHQPTSAHLDKDLYNKLWKINSDGGGFAYISNTGEIQVKKSMDRDWLWRKFETERSKNPRRDFMLHLRIRTHGTTDINNVHPFFVDEHTVMAHNGTIAKVPDYQDGRSDTKVFVDEVLPDLPEDWLDRQYIVDMVEEWIGWSRLMFLTTNPLLKRSVYILNKSKGTKHNGMWFSNSYGLPFAQKASITKSTNTVKYTAPAYTRESSEAWEYYNDYLLLSDEKEKNEESKKFKEELIEMRDYLGYRTEPTAVNFGGLDFECWTCDETIDEEGHCGCYAKWCLDCDNLCNDCECEQRMSYNHIWLPEMESINDPNIYLA